MKIIKELIVMWALVTLPTLLAAEPQDLQVFTDFEDHGQNSNRAIDFEIGISPVTAFFERGWISSFHENFYHSPTNVWYARNGFTIFITFETPAREIQFYVGNLFEDDGTIEFYDTDDNLLISETELPLEIIPSVSTFFTYNAIELGAPGGISRIIIRDDPLIFSNQFGPQTSSINIDDFGFSPISDIEPPTVTGQPASQEVQSGTTASLSVEASGDDLTYQWYTGNSGDTANPVVDATGNSLTTGALTVSTSFWVQITNAGGTTDSETAVVTVAALAVPLVLDGLGIIAGENIQHPNGNIFDQVLLTGESIQLQARPNQITRVSFMDENEDIVQVEFSGNGTFTVTLDPATFLPPSLSRFYNQDVIYVTGNPSVVIDGADGNTFFSIFTVGTINAVNQALFPEGQIYDAQADVTLVEVVNSTGMGGMQMSNTVFSGSTGKVGVDARGVTIGVRLTVGDIDADGSAVPYLLFGEGSFTVSAGNTGVRITGGDLLQTNGKAVFVAESGSTTTGFDTLITQNNFKSDNTPQPTQSIAATFANEDGDEITVTTEELTIE